MINKLFDLKGKVIILTGGYGVLGSCMAKYLAEQGASVVILGRNEDKGKQLVTSIINAGNEALFLKSDVLNADILEQNMHDILTKYAKIDILINAAGGNKPGATISPQQTIFDLDLNALKEVVDLNLYGSVNPTRIFLKAMVENGQGNIINISSESAIRPLTRVAGYGVAKAAISNFTKYMAGELALKFGDKFRINALAPGFFISEQNRSLLINSDGSYTDRAKSILTHTPFKRFGEPSELLGSLHYLASEASQFVTGSVLVVDGGFDAFSI